MNGSPVLFEISLLTCRAIADITLVSSLDEIAALCAELELLDTRTAEEILGYGERGVPEYWF